MPSVDELLNAAEVAEITLTETNDVIEIDADTRTMIIPETEKKLKSQLVKMAMFIQVRVHLKNLQKVM